MGINMKDNYEHTFAICAYGDSPYLMACIRSLKKQSHPGRIIMVTSTPSTYIERICRENEISLFINRGEKGIIQDWNFAYEKADTRYVTIAHQDDIYHEKYTEELCRMMDSAKRPLIFFTDYGEIRKGKIVVLNTLLKVKRLMLIPMEIKAAKNSRFIRRIILSLGSPICCPSVGFAKENVKAPVFQPGFRSNEDWQAWEKISREEGAFLYCKKRLVYHRIHEESATTRIIEDTGRRDEDIAMFRKFWPLPVAKLLASVYGRSEESNNM